MKYEKRPDALCARTVAVEMTTLMLYAVLIGVGAALLVAMPVALLAAA